MKFEQSPILSEKNKGYLKEVAEKIRTGDEYLPAVRQVLTNHRVKNETDVQRIMSELAPYIDAEVQRQIDFEHEKQDVLAEVDALRRGEPTDSEVEEDERRRSANEHIITPDGEDLDYSSNN